MKYCSKCGNDKLIEGIRFCLKCGSDIEVASKKRCFNCSSKLIQGVDYCLNCGIKVSGCNETKECYCKNDSNKTLKENKRHSPKSRLSIELVEMFLDV